MRRIAVIDIGSNSIKCLVAADRGHVVSLYENTLPVRIGRGLADKNPRLGSPEMLAGAEAVIQLYGECQRHGPIEETIVVATSAVRDAANGSDFARLIYTQAGIQPVILSGNDEARLIGRGVVEDPQITAQFKNFVVADLGGGSLELIALQGENVRSHLSLPLGAVRLTERFICDPRNRLPDKEAAQLDAHVRGTLIESGFPLQGPLIGTGGLVTVWRSMEAHAHGVTLPELSPTLRRSSLQSWIERMRLMTWNERLTVPGLPASRADIIIPGMLIVDAILDLAQADSLTHSRFNLRFGVAADWFARNRDHAAL